MWLTFNKRNANFPNRISRPSCSAQTDFARFFRDGFAFSAVTVPTNSREKGENEKKNGSGPDTRTIRTLIARRREKNRVPAVSSTGVLTSANLSSLRGAGSHALNLRRSRTRKCINSSWNCPRESENHEIASNRRQFVDLFFFLLSFSLFR